MRIVRRRLDRQQVEDGMEDVMLFQHRRQIALVRPEPLRRPYQERYLVLLLGGQFHRQAILPPYSYHSLGILIGYSMDALCLRI